MLTYQSLQTEWARTEFVLPKLPEKSNLGKAIYKELAALDTLAHENREIRENLKKSQKNRDLIVQYEKKSDAFSQASKEKLKYDALLLSKERIYTSAIEAEKRTIELLKQDLFKKEVNQEIAALKKDIETKKANNEAAKNEAINEEIKGLEEDLKLLETFLADINDKDSKMMKTIRAFAQEKARDGLDPSDVLAAEKANQVVAYAKDKHRKQENDPSLKTITRSYFSNGKSLEAHFERTADGLNIKISSQHISSGRFGLNGNRWGKKERKAHIAVAYDELVRQNLDHDFDLAGYSDLPETNYAYLDREKNQAWKRKYLAESMEYVSEKAEQTLKSINEPNNDYLVFKPRFMTCDSAIDTLKKDVLEENRTFHYRNELKTIISVNNGIHTKNARLAEKKVSQTSKIEQVRKTADFDQINAKKEAVLEAKKLAMITRDYIAQSLHHYPQNYSTLESFVYQVRVLEHHNTIATDAYKSIKASVERIEKEYEVQSKNLPKGHPDMIALEAALRQAKESLKEAESALQSLGDVISQVLTVFPPVDHTGVVSDIINNDAQCGVMIELLTQQQINSLRSILSKQPNNPITAEDVRQAVKSDSQQAMPILTSAYDRLVQNDPAVADRNQKIKRLIAAAPNDAAKRLLLESLNSRHEQQSSIEHAIQNNQTLLTMLADPNGLLTNEDKQVLNGILGLENNRNISQDNIRAALKRDPKKTMQQLDIAYDQLIKRDSPLADRDQKVASLINTLPPEKKSALVSLNDATITAAARNLSNQRESAREVINHDNKIRGIAAAELSKYHEDSALVLLANNGRGANILAGNNDCFLKTLEVSEAARRSIASNNQAMVSVLCASEEGRLTLAGSPRTLGAITQANPQAAAAVLARPEHASSAVAVLRANNSAGLLHIVQNNRPVFVSAMQASRAGREYLAGRTDFLLEVIQDVGASTIVADDIPSFIALMNANDDTRIAFYNKIESGNRPALEYIRRVVNVNENNHAQQINGAEEHAVEMQDRGANRVVSDPEKAELINRFLAVATNEDLNYFEENANFDPITRQRLIEDINASVLRLQIFHLDPAIKERLVNYALEHMIELECFSEEVMLASLTSWLDSNEERQDVLNALRQVNALTPALQHALEQPQTNTQDDPINADQVTNEAKLAVVTGILNSVQAEAAIDNIRAVPEDATATNNRYPAGSTMLADIANDFLNEEANRATALRFSDEAKQAAMQVGLNVVEADKKTAVINAIKTVPNVFNQALDESLQQPNALDGVNRDTVIAMLSESLKAEDELGVKGGAFNAVTVENHGKAALTAVVNLSNENVDVKKAVDGLLNLSRPESLAAHEAISKLAEIARGSDNIKNAFQAILDPGQQALVANEWDNNDNAANSIKNAIKLDPVRALAILDGLHRSAKESPRLVAEFINAHPESLAKIRAILKQEGNTNITADNLAEAKQINPELTAEAIDAAFAYTDPAHIKKAIDAHADANNVMRQHNKKQQETTLEKAKSANRLSDTVVDAESVQKQTDVVKMASGKASPAELFAVKRIVKALHNLRNADDNIKAAMVLAHPEGISALVWNNDNAKQAIAGVLNVNANSITEANIVECIEQAYSISPDATITAVVNHCGEALAPEKIQQAIEADPYRAYKNVREFVQIAANDPVTVAMNKTLNSNNLSQRVADVELELLAASGYDPGSLPDPSSDVMINPFKTLQDSGRNDQLNSDFCRAAILDAKKIALRDQLLFQKGTLEKWPGKEGVRITYTDGRDAIELSGDDVRAAIPEILRAAEDSVHNILTDNRAMLALIDQTSTDPDSNGQRLQQNLDNTTKVHTYAQEASAPLTHLREMVEDKDGVLGQLFVTDEKAIKKSEEEIKTLAKTEANAKTAYEAAYKVAEESIKNPRHAAYERLKGAEGNGVSGTIQSIKTQGIPESSFDNNFFSELAILVVNDKKIGEQFKGIVDALKREDEAINVDLTDHVSVKEFLERNGNILSSINTNRSLCGLLADQEKLVSTMTRVSQALNDSVEVQSAEPFTLARAVERERILREDPPQAVVQARAQARARARSVTGNIDNDPEVKKVIDQSITNDLLDKAPAVQAALQKAIAANPQVMAVKTSYDEAKKATEKANKDLQHLKSIVKPEFTRTRTLEAESKSQQQQSIEYQKDLKGNRELKKLKTEKEKEKRWPNKKSLTTDPRMIRNI